MVDEPQRRCWRGTLFALSLYVKNTNAKIDASSIQAFLCSLSPPIYNVENALLPILHELRQNGSTAKK